MNLCLFFEGTGKGVEGEITNVTRMRVLCSASRSQLLRLEPGPGTTFGSYLSGKAFGADWRAIFSRARRWFESSWRSLPPDGVDTRVFLFGFSRGALIARHFAAWLDKLGVEVAYMGLWDTVDSTAGLDVSETAPGCVRSARHAVSRDEPRRFFAPVRLLPGPRSKPGAIVEALFPGSHSDAGGLYSDDHAVADVSLAWIAAGACAAGAVLAAGEPPPETLGASKPVLHDPYRDATNLWGAFERVKRDVGSIPLHPAFRPEPGSAFPSFQRAVAALSHPQSGSSRKWANPSPKEC